MSIFSDKGIKFAAEDQRYLATVVNSTKFTKIMFAKTQPHAAYEAFCQCEVRKYRCFLRTIPGMKDCIKPLDDLRPEFDGILQYFSPP